jgi:hypothetical protein
MSHAVLKRLYETLKPLVVPTMPLAASPPKSNRFGSPRLIKQAQHKELGKDLRAKLCIDQGPVRRSRRQIDLERSADGIQRLRFEIERRGLRLLQSAPPAFSAKRRFADQRELMIDEFLIEAGVVRDEGRVPDEIQKPEIRFSYN